MTRIIAGLAKGRRLAVPQAGTRPTSDRAREGLFNTLAASVALEGARVLDLFAGTGAVGLEALSRGAATAVLVESNHRAAAVLRANVETVGLPGAQVVAAPVDRFLAAEPHEPHEPHEPFDLVFADPPYAYDAAALAGIATAVARQGWLTPDGTLVIEHSTRASPAEADISELTTVAEKRYGETAFWYGRPR